MKFRLPPDCLGLSFAGKVVSIAADRTIEADASAAAALAAHGVLRADEPEPTRPASAKAKQGRAS